MDDDKKEKNSPEYTESLNAVFFRSSIIDKIASKNRFVNLVSILIVVFLVLGIGLRGDSQLYNIGNIFILVSVFLALVRAALSFIVYTNAPASEVSDATRQVDSTISNTWAGKDLNLETKNKKTKLFLKILIIIFIIPIILAVYQVSNFIFTK